jgi:inward rectifier potassium channel
MTWPQFFAGLLALYLSINFLFALLYFVVPGSVVNLTPDSLTDAFFFSIETLATVGYGNMAPVTLYAHTVSAIAIFVGMLLTATMTGLVFVRFSKPKAKLLFAEQVVVSRKNGVCRLMIRVGNGRMNALSDANIRISTLTDFIVDGQLFHSLVDWKLVRADIPFFPLIWNVMHEISEDSPLAYLRTADHACLQASHLRLMVSRTARDPALGAQVYAIDNHGANDIALKMRYADAITASNDDHSVADCAISAKCSSRRVPSLEVINAFVTRSTASRAPLRSNQGYGKSLPCAPWSGLLRRRKLRPAQCVGPAPKRASGRALYATRSDV